MKNCPKCGAELVPGMPFCSKCGKPVSSSAEKSVVSSPMMPQQPKPGMPQQPKPGMPSRPQMPRPATPSAPSRPSAPTAPSAPSQGSANDKGFFSRVGAGIASAMTGGTFSGGYERQRNEENTNRTLVQGVPMKLQDARESFKRLQKKYPDVIDSVDEVEFNKLIAAVEAAVANSGSGVRAHNLSIKRALSAVDRKLSELQDKANPRVESSNSGNRENSRPRSITTGELYDINPDELAIVEHKATWGIQRGQLARRITERELDAVEGLDGVIIQHGCSALVFVNGELVKTMESGAYKLQIKSDNELKQMIEKLTNDLMANHKEKVAKAEAEAAKANNGNIAARGGLLGIAGSWIKRGLAFVFGSSPVAKQANSKDKELEAMKKFKAEAEKIVKKENEHPLLSIILVSNRFFSLIFGGVESENGISFSPYIIPMGFLDVNVGVEVEMHISNVSDFAINYLTDRNSLTTNDVFNMLKFDIENTLRQELRNREYTQQGFDAALRSSLAQKVQASINNRLYGMECTKILNITDSQEDVFERFRQVEKEIFCSEKELEFLDRTNEIRNRMEQAQNRQLVNSARNKEELSYAMQQIDKDHLLHDDEMAEFVMLLETQRMIREATTKEEASAQLLTLYGNRLVKEDELEAIKDAIERDKINRAEITDIMRIQSDRKVEMERMMAEFALNDTRTDHDWEREDLERRRRWGIEDEEREREWMREEREYNRDFARRAQEDDYDFQKMMREREVRKEDEQIAYERARQEREYEDQQQRANLETMLNFQAASEDRKNQHEVEMAQISSNERMNRDNTFVHMDAEQIRAAQLKDLSSEAQVAMANAYGSNKEAEVLREQQRRDDENRQREMENIMKMAAMIKDTATASNYSHQQRIDELQNENRFQQQRYDRAQESAMNNITQVSTAAANNINAFNGGIGGGPVYQQAPQQQAPQQQVPQMFEYQCYNCQKVVSIAHGTPHCPACGAPFEWN